VKAQSVPSLARESILGREESLGECRVLSSSELERRASKQVSALAARDLKSIITTGSMKRMNLKEGDKVFAIIKATEVSVEKE
jgi:molybdopterin-binding protein